MVVLVHENHDKWPNVTAGNRGSKYLPKINYIRVSYVYIFEYEHLKRFI